MVMSGRSVRLTTLFPGKTGISGLLLTDNGVSIACLGMVLSEVGTVKLN